MHWIFQNTHFSSNGSSTTIQNFHKIFEHVEKSVCLEVSSRWVISALSHCVLPPSKSRSYTKSSDLATIWYSAHRTTGCCPDFIRIGDKRLVILCFSLKLEFIQIFMHSRVSSTLQNKVSSLLLSSLNNSSFLLSFPIYTENIYINRKTQDFYFKMVTSPEEIFFKRKQING